ncbi:hypothetical protein [Nostoc sp. WHI]|uniref:hypothetical protein n=1 Tax=Nostoc sp. WHI TaxID=2650611 RepID=UPI0018C6F517|nr:hypothetical protein [Nostoc sp. WHI]
MSSELFQHEGQIEMSENDLNNISRTNWEALESISNDEIDYSDIPPLTDEFFEKATLRIPAPVYNLARSPDLKFM